MRDRQKDNINMDLKSAVANFALDINNVNTH